jgi:DNA-binding SARP family transcriptional activator
MDFRVLGPLEVGGDEGTLELGGVKQRSVLAMLLLHANEVVSSDRLIDALWGASPPLRAAKTIQVYVSRLRKALPDDRLVTRAPGYVLYLDHGELDLARFERLVAEAREAPPAIASSKLSEALALWRGPPLADLAYEQFAQAEITRLEEMRLTVVEQRLDADLALGRHAELVSELETLVAKHPLREHLRYQLMLALYRSDRQADALDAYRAARRELSEGLGLEPSASLRELEAAILRQDPELAPSAGAPSEPAAARPDAQERALLVAPSELGELGVLLSVAKPLAFGEPGRELIVAGVVGAEDVAEATTQLATVREQLLAETFAARTAAFSSPDPGEDLARLASQESVDLVLMDTPAAALDGPPATVLERAPCDVALLIRGSGAPREGAVVVPFGAGEHDWAALELGAWFARSTGGPLRLVGAADGRRKGRDASRLLADASLIVQRTAGIVAEPVLTASGPAGVADAASGAAVLIIGLSERWREEGLGRTRGELAGQPPASTVFVRRGARPGGLAPAETRTRFSWSMAGSAA